MDGLKYDKELYTDSGFYAGDMDEGYTDISEKLIKCRKDHSCANCQKIISKGSYAVRETALFQGEGWKSSYTCTDCIEKWLEESNQVGEIE